MNLVFEKERGRQFLKLPATTWENNKIIIRVISKRHIMQRMCNGKVIHDAHACAMHHTKIKPNMFLNLVIVSTPRKAWTRHVGRPNFRGLFVIAKSGSTLRNHSKTYTTLTSGGEGVYPIPPDKGVIDRLDITSFNKCLLFRIHVLNTYILHNYLSFGDMSCYI